MQMFDIFFDFILNNLLNKELPVSWDAMIFMWYHRNDIHCYKDVLFIMNILLALKWLSPPERLMFLTIFSRDRREYDPRRGGPVEDPYRRGEDPYRRDDPYRKEDPYSTR